MHLYRDDLQKIADCYRLDLETYRRATDKYMASSYGVLVTALKELDNQRAASEELEGLLTASQSGTATLVGKINVLEADLKRANEKNLYLESLISRQPGSPPGATQDIEALAAWQDWWSKTMRPAVVKLLDATSTLVDNVREDIAPVWASFPKLNEFPVQIKREPDKVEYIDWKDGD